MTLMSLKDTTQARRVTRYMRDMATNLAQEKGDDASVKFLKSTLAHATICLLATIVHRTVVPDLARMFQTGEISQQGAIFLLYIGQYLGNVEPGIICGTLSIFTDVSLYSLEKKVAMRRAFAEALSRVRVSIPPILIGLTVLLVVDVETFQVVVRQLFEALKPLVHDHRFLFRELVGTAQIRDVIMGFYGVVVSAMAFSSYRTHVRGKLIDSHSNSEDQPDTAADQTLTSTS